MPRASAPNKQLLSLLPSVDELLRSETGLSLLPSMGQKRLSALAREVISELRSAVKDDETGDLNGKKEFLRRGEERLGSAWQTSRKAGLKRVINATGVVVHTNLGRAPLSDAATAAVVDAAGYCNLEYDLAAGERGGRSSRVETLLCDITGSEAALVVNNCAAAAYLILTTFAIGSEVIISRGELVEIGGEFRVPDVLARSGASLVEVGTTNRTRIADYEAAITDRTSMILKVHPSNYRIVGFTESPLLADLAELAHRKGLLLYEDAGSGAFADLTTVGMADEPVISDSIAAGADLTTFSGDKLLGGPQAGLIVGKKDLIEKLRKDPLYRALRAGKLVLAALEATLEMHGRGTAFTDVPVLKMLSIDATEIARRSEEIVRRLINPRLQTTLIAGSSAVGGGSAPLAQPETVLIQLTHSDMTASEVERKLRHSEIPIITRILNDRVVIDLRTISEKDESDLLAALAGI
jgi:L-seryl-tRNA(Ser) seleniumtransferase